MATMIEKAQVSSSLINWYWNGDLQCPVSTVLAKLLLVGSDKIIWESHKMETKIYVVSASELALFFVEITSRHY